MNECCKNCYFFRPVMKHPTYQEVLTHICDYFIVQEQAAYILETTENDVCECWTERRDNNVV